MAEVVSSVTIARSVEDGEALGRAVSGAKGRPKGAHARTRKWWKTEPPGFPSTVRAKRIAP